MVAKISFGSSLYGALAYNGEKINKEEGKLLATNKIFDDCSGKTSIANALRDFQRTGVDPADVAGIGISNQRETTVAWKRTTGEPLCDAVVYFQKSFLLQMLALVHTPDKRRETKLCI